MPIVYWESVRGKRSTKIEAMNDARTLYNARFVEITPADDDDREEKFQVATNRIYSIEPEPDRDDNDDDSDRDGSGVYSIG